MKRAGTVVIVISLWMMLIPTSVGTQQPPLPQRTLVVGTKEAPPFSMKTADGQWRGLSIDLWRQIAAELNLAFELRELTLKQLLDGVANRSLDAAVAALTISQLESVIKDPEDLPKVTVGTIANTTGEAYLNQSRISALAYTSTQEALAALREGKIQALVYDAPILRYYIQQNYAGSLQVLPNRLLRQDYGIALQPNSPLREQINVVLLQKIREKSWQDKISQYLGE